MNIAPEADLSFKAATGTLSIDEMQGIVECFVAAVGNKDSVGDIVLPGAFSGSLKRRKPRVVWGHDWNQPIGKVLEIYEVSPTDRRLPKKMRDAGVGGVYARVQFNLKSERGREAFNSVVFFGEEQEWSIGYKTLDSIYDQSRQANLLKELELYEVSPVLHGANQLTATISVKSDSPDKEEAVDSFQKSKWKKFDPEFAEMIKTEHPEVWRLGGNIKGNDQYRALKPVSDRGGKATSQAEVNALELREAWVARHYEDFRPAGVMAQIKWLAVGSRGEAYMKRVIREEIAKRSPQEKMDSSPSTSQETDGAKLKAEIAKTLSDRFGGMSRIVRITPEEVIFEHAPNSDAAIEGKWSRFKATYSQNEDDDKIKIGPAMAAEEESEAEEKAADSGDPIKVGTLVRWNSSGGTAYGKVVRTTANGSIEAVPEGPKMEGTEGNPAYGIQVWKQNNGEWNATDVVVVHRRGGLTPLRQLPQSKSDEADGVRVKAPSASDLTAITDAVGLDPVPQERVTGDVLRGYGPRRGNLERLLRYWRPIMRKPGGFRRCRVILADHPELYPLENICAWLHHETTGLWPNEGCHHPGMKNCRKKMRNVVRGSIWSDADFESRMRSRFKKDASASLEDYAPAEREYINALRGIVAKYGKLSDGDDSGIYVGYESDNENAAMGIKCANCAFYQGDGRCEIVARPVAPEGKCRLAAIDYDSVDTDDYAAVAFANKILSEFVTAEPQFIAILLNEDNWEHVGDDEDGNEYPHMMLPSHGDDDEEEDGDEEEFSARLRQMLGRQWGRQESKPGGCGCGCGGSKSEQQEEKIGRVLSSRNLQKVQEALNLLQEVIASSNQDIQMKQLSVPALAGEIKSAIEPVVDYYNLNVKVSDFSIQVAGFDDLSAEAKSALDTALSHSIGENSYVVIQTDPESMMSLKSLVDEIAEPVGANILIDEEEGLWLAVQARSKPMVDQITEKVSGSGMSIKGFGMGELEYDCGCDD